MSTREPRLSSNGTVFVADSASAVTQFAVIIMAVLAFLFLVQASYRMRAGTSVAGNSQQLRQNLIDGMATTPTFRRSEVQDLLQDVPTWACSVCEFNNLEGVAHCSLCLTPRDTYLIEANDSVTTFRHGQVSLQPPLVPRPVMNTLFYLHSVLPEDLNPRQRSARMRRQWTRAIDADGAVTWACHFTNAPCSTSSHVVQV
ncbi:hypothetical protein As57867_005655, partial [Aphanomyces stellatus]